MKKNYKILLSIISVCIFIVFNLFKTKNYNQIIEIKKDESLYQSLKELSVSKSFFFKLYLKLKNQGRDIKAGYYELDGKYSIYSLIETFETGKDKFYKFVIPEGYTLEQIVNKLVEEKKLNKKTFYEELSKVKDFPYPTPKGNFEGYFYPATYNFPDFYTEKDVINKILSEFLKKFPVEKYEDKETFYKKLILASIIEKEAVKTDEKSLISSVFYNRMKIGMPLASDATINYLYKFSKRRILYKDLKINSLYNTYKYKGLPPTPIANPDRVSIEAAYNPQKTRYLFFVAKGDGYHYFSKTYREHLNFQKRK